jgi:hypothetical protein
MNGISSNQLAETFVRGTRLAETSMGIGVKDSLIEAKGWKEMVAGIKDDKKRALCAIMLENYRKYRKGLDEATSTLQVGNFDKWAFPIISIVSENLIAQDLVSVQPLEGPSGLVFFMNFTAGQSKGNVQRGAKIWDARTGHAERFLDSSDRVPNEPIVCTTGDLSSGAAISLAYAPVVPGTVSVAIGTSVLRDDGNGNLVVVSGPAGGAGIDVGDIDYPTGLISFTTAENTATVAEFSYNYNPELNPEAQQVDFEIQSSPIYAQERKLRGRWSTEAAQALEALHQINAEDVVSTAITNHLQWEIDREIIEDLRRQAGAGLVRWSAQIPATSYISYTEHKLSFIDALVTGSNFIYRATNRAKANWVLAGMQATNILETLPQFEPHGGADTEVEGVSMLGTIGRTKVYSDPHYNVDEALMGYKGNDFVRTGYIFAPWILLYSTMLITLDDFIARKGFASQYGKKLVNSKFYCKLQLSGFSAEFGSLAGT